MPSSIARLSSRSEYGSTLPVVRIEVTPPAKYNRGKLAACSGGKPWERAQDEYGTLHTAWRVTDPAAIEEVVLTMRDKKLVIADGHHRYETALAYRNDCHAQSLPDDRPEYVMVTFVRMESEGLTIEALPILVS